MRADRLASEQADKVAGQQADKLTSEQAGKRASRKAGKPENGLAGNLASRQAIHLLIIFVIGFLAYSNTFHGPFQWDEADYIVNNPFIKSLDYFMHPSRGANLLDDALVSRYIGYLTFALNYHFDGLDVTGYHIVNLAIHLINAMLVYYLVLLTFKTPYLGNHLSAVSSQQSAGSRVVKWSSGNDSTTQQLNDVKFSNSSLFTLHSSRFMALAVALLFVSHPVQTEAVTYVFQRFKSLVSLFYLLSLVLYIRGRQSAISSQQSAENARFTLHDSRFTIIWYVLSLLSAILAMKTKENAFTLPVVITLYEFLFFSGPVKSRLLRLTPFLLTMIIIPYTIISTESGHAAGEIMGHIKDPVPLGYQQLSRAEYLFTQFRVLVQKMFATNQRQNATPANCASARHAPRRAPVFVRG